MKGDKRVNRKNQLIAAILILFIMGLSACAPSGGIIHVEAGLLSSYAIRDDGTLWAWGVNDLGQLGDGTTTDRRSPVQISIG
ncbi:MAG: hypothetical protein FWE12_01670 [Oscillospiraceae bacterium]|nr:hypothetical protein [Oscillospiraceae bacterium]